MHLLRLYLALAAIAAAVYCGPSVALAELAPSPPAAQPDDSHWG